MQYNETLFGEKIPAYPNSLHNNLLFNFSTKNISVQSLYHNGIELGAEFPDDLYYWQISADSPYSAMSYKNRGGSSGAYTYNKYDGEKNIGNIPIVLATGKPKRDTDFNFDVNGMFDGNVSMHNTGAESLYASKIKPVNNNAPNWYRTDALPSTIPTQGFFNGTAFITDFNYNDVISEILVGIGDYPNTTLANYIANSNTAENRIKSIGVKIYAGGLRSGNSKTRTSLQYGTYNENGVEITRNVGFSGIVTDYKYNVPDVVKALLDYPYNELCRTETLYAASDYMLLFSGNCGSSLTTFYQCYLLEDDKWEHPEGATGFYLKKSGDDVYNDDDFNYIRKLVAYLGFWFSDGGNSSALLGIDALDYGEPENVPTGIYQSVIEDGVTTGDFIPLSIARNNDQSKWGNEFRDKDGYQGRTDGTSSKESSKSSKATYSSSLASFGNIWLMNESGISILANALKTLVTDEQNPYDPTLFYGQNPVDCIISIKEYPIDISSCIDVIRNPEPVSLGRWNNITYTDGGIGVRLAAPLVTVKSASSPFSHITISIPAYYKNLGYPFMDYEPYSSYHLYLPFCGTVKIPSELAIESRIEVLYYADVLSGACIAHIYINYKYYCSAQGQLATEVPVSGYKISDYTRDMLNATYAQKQAYAAVASDVGRIISSAGSAGLTLGISDKRAWGNSAPSIFPNMSAGNLTKLGGLTMGLGSAIQAGADMWSKYETIKYNKTLLDHSAPAPVKSSLGGGIVNWESPYFVEMLVQRPVFMEGYNAEVFNATMGRACYLADTLGNHSGGYVEAINCKLSGFPATQTEKVELAKLLADGVFL